jgi:hypothetical protein
MSDRLFYYNHGAHGVSRSKTRSDLINSTIAGKEAVGKRQLATVNRL